MIINGNLDLSYSSIESLGNLEKVEKWLDLYDCKNLISLGNLKEVKGWLNLNNCINLKSLSNLKEVGGDLYLRNTTISQLPKDIKIGGDLYLYDSKITKEYIKEYHKELFNQCKWELSYDN